MYNFDDLNFKNSDRRDSTLKATEKKNLQQSANVLYYQDLNEISHIFVWLKITVFNINAGVSTGSTL